MTDQQTNKTAEEEKEEEVLEQEEPVEAAENSEPEEAPEAAPQEPEEDWQDKYTRLYAEFQNFRRRTEKEKSAMFDMGAKSILEKLLPVIDNFERAFSTVPEDPEAAQYAKGMEMIYRQLLKNLEDAGATPIDCKGKPFDPNYHNAVMHVEDESLGENVIVEEFQKGYMYKDSVLRYSMVKVAN